MLSEPISEFYSDDYTKKAVVIKASPLYYIDFFKDDAYLYSIAYSECLKIVEDIAENYVYKKDCG